MNKPLPMLLGMQEWLKLLSKDPKQILNRIHELDGYVHRECGGSVVDNVCLNCGQEPDYKAITRHRTCPAAMLGHNISKLYAQPHYRKALDLWDQGIVTKRDIYNWARYLNDRTSAGKAQKKAGSGAGV